MWRRQSSCLDHLSIEQYLHENKFRAASEDWWWSSCQCRWWSLSRFIICHLKNDNTTTKEPSQARFLIRKNETIKMWIPLCTFAFTFKRRHKKKTWKIYINTHMWEQVATETLFEFQINRNSLAKWITWSILNTFWLLKYVDHLTWGSSSSSELLST